MQFSAFLFVLIVKSTLLEMQLIAKLHLKINLSTRIKLGLSCFILFLSLSSCDVLLDILIPEPTSAIDKLELRENHYPALFGNSYIEGEIRNNSNDKIYDIKLKVVVYGTNGSQIDENTFELDVDLSPNGFATFRKDLYIKWRDVGSYTLEIIQAKS